MNKKSLYIVASFVAVFLVWVLGISSVQAAPKVLIGFVLPLTESSGGLSGWALVDAVLRDFPELRLVVTDHGCWGQDRYFRPLVERYDHLYLDTARFELDGGVAEFCRVYGPDRLLFGTGYPQNYMGGPLLTVAHADISEEERVAVFGGNLRRLLGEVRL